MSQPERRGGRRRKLVLPVMFCCLGEQRCEYRRYVGQISDVGDGGMRIELKSSSDQSAGNKLVVFVPFQESIDSEYSGRMVEIMGEVVWFDQASFSLGLRYL